LLICFLNDSFERLILTAALLLLYYLCASVPTARLSRRIQEMIGNAP